MRVVPDPHRKDSSGSSPKDRITPITTSSSLSKSGRRALSFVDTLAFDGKISLVQVRIETGRTHQIRVHLQDRKTPIYGDEVYGIADWNKRLLKSHGIQRPLLHAYRLELDHPISGEPMTIEAPMAQDMCAISQGIWQEGPEELPVAFDSMHRDELDPAEKDL
jgi:23S rRNA-/tRNA-specific pseudouridylate synthase